MSESSNISKSSLYKFKELKVYSSTEWLADNKKKYRQVFDRYTTSYVYAELTFHNKNFDRENWDLNIQLKCFGVKNSKEVCTLNFNRTISRFDSIVYIREGWGNKREGSFWKRGTYYWEAWLDGKKVATKYFYIEDTGMSISEDMNPYIELDSLRLYEGTFDDVPLDDRTYLTTFSIDNTRYVHTEVSLTNNYLERKWYCEVFVKYYNESRELKGQITKFIEVEAGADEINFSVGWGSNNAGTWRKGRYTVEVVFMDTLMSIVPFDVDDVEEEGIPYTLYPIAPFFDEKETKKENTLTYDEVKSRFDKMIGLEAVKNKIAEHTSYINFLKLRKNKGFKEEESINIHSVFMGNPGTGKTTVAKMMGMLYKNMGLLSKGHVYEVDRVDLVGEYIGQTAPKVKEAIKKAKGGVLFIDEAYALARTNDDKKDFGREVIEILMREMSNGSGDMSVIVAGYPKEMDYFINSNPGLKSRFKHFYEFKDYLPQELIQIADVAASDKEIQLNEKPRELINDILTEAYRTRDRSFGNARFVYDLIDKVKMNFGLRIMNRKSPEKLSFKELSTVAITDVQKLEVYTSSAIPNIPIDDKLLKQALYELNELIGMQNIKDQIAELVSIVQYKKQVGQNVLNQYSFHTVFVGNPGTGKTTVARILTKIYKALGVLERGQMVETDRQGLVSGYVGQTAIKTKERIDEAIGGVLFIDEAYALNNLGGARGDFGSEAIQKLLKEMEDKRGEFYVFVAGYPDNMDRFLKANPGLKSRFDITLSFTDYSVEELHRIAEIMIVKQGYSLSQKASKELVKRLEKMYATRDKYFGNARTVRKLISEILRKQNIRVANQNDDAKSRPSQIVASDIAETEIQNESDIFRKDSIGFK